MTTRPKNSPTQWATDNTYTSGPENGGPNKYEIPAGVAAQGHVPADRPAPGYENTWKNEVGRRLDAYDLIDALNWLKDKTTNIATVSGGSGLGEFYSGFALQYQTDAGYYLVWAPSNNTSLLESYDGGYNWTVTNLVATSAFVDVDNADRPNGSVVAVYEIAAGAHVAVRRSGGWLNTAIAGAPQRARVVRCDRLHGDGGTFYVGGRTGAVGLGLWRVETGDGTTIPPTITLLTANLIPPPSAGDARIIDLIACGEVYNMCASSTATVTTAEKLFRWDPDTDGNNYYEVTPPINSQILDLLWLPENKEFWLIYASAIYRSATGDIGTWTLVDTPLTCQFKHRAACVRGGITVIPTLWQTIPYFLVTGDAGETWELVPDPINEWFAGTADAALIVRCIGNRFIAAEYNGAGDHALIFSARTGRS